MRLKLNEVVGDEKTIYFQRQVVTGILKPIQAQIEEAILKGDIKKLDVKIDEEKLKETTKKPSAKRKSLTREKQGLQGENYMQRTF